MPPVTLTAPPATSARPEVRHWQPGRRFAGAALDTYRPDPAYPSQEQAREQIRRFVEAATARQHRSRFASWPWRSPVGGRGLYLDGGFGVGKTHLLVGAYRQAGAGAAYLHFQELTSLAGSLGLPATTQTLSGLRLLCIDEFELDDPGNARLLAALLERLMEAGVNVVTTSNTAPGALGVGRFDTSRFRETLGHLAARFIPLHIGGPDHRVQARPRDHLLTPDEWNGWRLRHAGHRYAQLTAPELDALLTRVHPAAFGAMLADVEALTVTDLTTFTHPDQRLREQGGLRFVHFIDKVYDLGLPVALSGASLDALFDPTYRQAGFGRKYSRCLSRVAQLTQEAAAPGAPDP